MTSKKTAFFGVIKNPDQVVLCTRISYMYLVSIYHGGLLCIVGGWRLWLGCLCGLWVVGCGLWVVGCGSSCVVWVCVWCVVCGVWRVFLVVGGVGCASCTVVGRWDWTAGRSKIEERGISALLLASTFYTSTSSYIALYVPTASPMRTTVMSSSSAVPPPWVFCLLLLVILLGWLVGYLQDQERALSQQKRSSGAVVQSVTTPSIVIKADRVTVEGAISSSSSNSLSSISNPSSSISSISSSSNPITLTAQSLRGATKNYAPEIQLHPTLCKSKRLFGREHNGGWFVCGDDLPSGSAGRCVVYSYGLGADWSFDTAAEQEASCEVHGFDPSGLLWRQGMHGRDFSGIDYAAQYPSKLKTFHNWGLGVVDKALYPVGTVPQEWPGLGDPQLSKSNTEPWLLKSVERTMVELGHVATGLSILKIDTEGSEWDAVTAFLGSSRVVTLIQAGKIPQLLLEWHWDPDSTARNQRHAALMRKVEDLGYRPWYVNRHQGSECCLDVSYVWRGGGKGD